MELWDLYNADGIKTGNVIKRGNSIEEGYYHLAVEVWILNSNSQILIQKRSKSKKTLPNMWGMTTGCIVSGEDSLEGAIREAKEEIGIDITKDEMKVFRSMIHEDTLWDVYLVKKEYDISKAILQEEEVAGLLIASTATKVGSFGVNILLAFLLSLLLLLEKNEIKNFGDKLSDSKISFIYNSLVFFGKSFVKNFGEVMKVQVMIAFINSVVSMIFLGFMGFPQIWALGFMIFVLGLIPVAGVIVSLIPLTVIAFNTGGITKVFGVLLMICIVHAVETYILNPKLMSNRTKLPVCFVFIILLVGEHYLGVWGLLIGVPIFMFLMDILGVKFTSR